VTDAMATALPTGVLPHGVDWNHIDLMLDGQPLPASLEVRKPRTAGMLLCPAQSRQSCKCATARMRSNPPPKPSVALTTG
jgi:hypothetical protein